MRHMQVSQYNVSCTTYISGCFTRSKQVPSILLSTGEIPPELLTRGEGCLVQARVCRPKKRLKNEENASFVSTVSIYVLCKSGKMPSLII